MSRNPLVATGPMRGPTAGSGGRCYWCLPYLCLALLAAASLTVAAGSAVTTEELRSMCEANYGRHTLTLSTIPLQKRVPSFTPVMITAPFAGSTTAREVFEYSTGFYSGSFGEPHIRGYSWRENNKLKEYFYRDGNCSFDSSVVSVDEFERASITEKGTFAFSFASDRLKCRR
jgi:hypothetical protein